MHHSGRSLITLHCFSLLAFACDPDDLVDQDNLFDQDNPPVEDDHDAALDQPVHPGPATLRTPSEPVALTTDSFLFQSHLLGATSTRVCDFNDLKCYTPNMYHTGLDDSATSSTPIRAANFGVRSLKQNLSASDKGMGNAVAVSYLLANGTYMYATDNHMSSHHPLSTRPDGAVAVPRGTKLGNVGASGYGNPTYWGTHPHAHHEMKTQNIWGACGANYWGYTPSNATNYCYVDPDAHTGVTRVLIPEFSLANSGWGDYDVLYGVVNTPVYSRIRIEQSTEAIALAGVSGRLGWGGSVFDFPMDANKPPGSHTVVQSRQFSTPGDYRMNASVKVGNEWRGGYPVIFSILPKSTDFIRDNDMGTASFKSGGLGLARFDGYGYGAFAATGNSKAWAQWYAQRSGNFRLWVYVGGNGVGSVRFKIYPTGAGNPIYSDPVNLSSAVYGWVQLRAGATTSWSFTASGYVGLSADAGSASDVYLFDAIKFSS